MLEEEKEAVVRILIVDNSELVRGKLMSVFLNDPRVEELYLAQDAAEANNLIKKIIPDIAVIDTCLPQDQGWDILKNIKKLYPQIHTIMLTSYADKYFNQKSKELGADYLFEKFEGVERALEILENFQLNKKIMEII
ncbi:MAG: response regulator [Candidatus Omnitrophota bacterium]